MKGFIDVEYELLKEAVKRIEAKKKVCKVLPSARFSWEHSRITGNKIQVGNHMPRFSEPNECSKVSLECLVCDRLGGESTGIAAEHCRNCSRKSSK